MSVLRSHLDDYLELRRSLGFGLGRTGQILAGLVTYLDEADAATVTAEHALAFATAPAGADPSWWRIRMAAVRPFARYLEPLVPGTEVPPRGMLPGPVSRRAVPYLYSDGEIAALLAAAGRFRDPFRVATWQALIGLLASTGMRVGEVTGLDRGDLDGGLLTIRAGKFGKTRQLPLHDSAAQALEGYASLRDARPAQSPAFFLSLRGKRMLYKNVHSTFHGLVQKAGLEPRSPACRPRIHDLRHTFAVNAVTRWQAEGTVTARLPSLSAWLGHASPASTYWYLTATPELLALAAAGLEQQEDDEEGERH
jgi:integrase/recombinase XerD